MSGEDLNVVGAAALVLVRDDGGPRRGRAQGEVEILADGAVAIRSGRIVAAGPTDEVLRAAGPAPTLDARGRTVLPGLVESHTHPLFGGDRHHEYAEKLSGTVPRDPTAPRGIGAAVLHTREADDGALLSDAARAYAKLLRGGATTVEVKTGYGQSTRQELRALDLLHRSRATTPQSLVLTFLGAHVVPPEAADAESYAGLVRDEMLPAVVEQGIADLHDLVCERGVFDEGLAAELLDASRKAGLPARVHADANAASRGWATAVAGGAIAADHLTYTPDSEIREVGTTSTVAVLLPVAEQLYLDERRANARLFIDEGVPVALATDYCSALHPTSTLLSLALGTSWFRMTPAEAIVATTLNAAYACARGHDRGSIDIGKRGDLTIVDCPHPNEICVSMGTAPLGAVVIEGRVVLGGSA
ncbi:amidohydrolase family protein [Streptomyces sp. NBC_01089]|uniref:amidohydrolase family protein n=1 Tax=Streptomyces sp. NBC_01089 TaxID=2903747 RepID=UPI0038698706|nr:amidohydrolase family protein [Streptomyces sp. NBC_01089]